MKYALKWWHCLLLLVFCDAASAAAPLVLTSPRDYQVFQRQTRTHGIVRIAGQLTTEGEVQWRLLGRPFTGTLPTDWQSTRVNAAQNAFNAEFSVPAGGWYQFEIRLIHHGETVFTQRVEHVGVGEVFLITGQSNSANYGAEKQTSQSGMVSSFDGAKWVLANDPQPGASGNGGSFLPTFGDAINAQFQVPIGLVSFGVGGTSVRQWLPAGERMTNQPTTGANVKLVAPGEWECDGKLFTRLAQRCAALGTNGFRALLWHQGESDAGQAREGYPADRQITGEQYRDFMTKLIRAARTQAGWDFPWFVAQATYHSERDAADEEFRAAQKSLADSVLVLAGPDTDALRAEYRTGVHFNGKGLVAHGQLWAEKVSAWLLLELP